MKFEIYADEVRREGMLEYLKTHRTKLTKKQIFDLTWSYMYENYMLNGHTHAVARTFIVLPPDITSVMPSPSRSTE